jgi:DNA-directed RNA polymerase alpha subunit
MRNGRIDSVGQLLLLTEEEVRAIYGVGKESFKNIKAVLAANGLRLGMTRPT